jgi:hypothetical protein
MFYSQIFNIRNSRQNNLSRGRLHIRRRFMSPIRHIYQDFGEIDQILAESFDIYNNLQDIKTGLVDKNLLDKTKIELSEKEEICIICQENIKLGAIIRTINCLHSFHIDCIDKWFVEHKNCPLCKFSL